MNIAETREEIRAQVAEHLTMWAGKCMSIEVGGLSLELAPRVGGHIEISRFVVPRAMRGEGVGTAVMWSVAAWADRMGYTLTLTPSKGFGATSVARLEKFYGRHGFIRNRGRYADLTISEAMRRVPR
ncbi:GNAT family N-acetyltransferase [Micromonospora sp. NPDC047730]|uniref:GNAT family N-acetyltransferase n=1 Tax=Micromonospora sp. NPDC047730 TaxID=3364253 RepID=UPI00371F2782